MVLTGFLASRPARRRNFLLWADYPRQFALTGLSLGQITITPSADTTSYPEAGYGFEFPFSVTLPAGWTQWPSLSRVYLELVSGTAPGAFVPGNEIGSSLLGVWSRNGQTWSTTVQAPAPAAVGVYTCVLRMRYQGFVLKDATPPTAEVVVTEVYSQCLKFGNSFSFAGEILNNS